jgi:hypothetical protein
MDDKVAAQEWEWIDTGSGPGAMQRVAALTKDLQLVVYRAYIEHVQGCEVCLKGANCNAAEDMWAEYRELRSTD